VKGGNRRVLIAVLLGKKIIGKPGKSPFPTDKKQGGKKPGRERKEKGGQKRKKSFLEGSWGGPIGCLSLGD